MTAPEVRRAVVLVSGGLDSAVALAVAKSQSFEPYALTFQYGQRHAIEVDAAARVAESIGVARHAVVDIDLTVFGGSALTDPAILVPYRETPEDMGEGIPPTYVPARNTIFLSYAMAWAETLGAADLFIGVNAQDRSGYPDCRPEFLSAFERLASVATASGVGGQHVTVHAPLSSMAKADIIAWGNNLGVDFSLTHSCYNPTDSVPCRRCDACVLRADGFARAGLTDPAAQGGVR